QNSVCSPYSPGRAWRRAALNRAHAPQPRLRGSPYRDRAGDAYYQPPEGFGGGGMRRVFRDWGYIMRGIVRWSGRLRGVAPLAVVLALVFVVQPSLTTLAQVVPPPPAPPAAQAVPVIGEVERLTVHTPGDGWSGGTSVVGGQSIIIPRNLLIDFPANRLTLQQTFAQ